MVKYVKMMAAAAALTVAVAAGSHAQDEPKKGRTQPGQGGRGGMTMGGGMGGSVYAMIATNETLQKELKVTDDQKKKLEEVSKAQREKMTEAMKGFGRDMTDEQRKEMREKMEKFQAESKKAYSEVLDKAQVKRADQIGYQMQGVRAFSSKDVQDGLKLTDEQKEKIKAVSEQYTKDSMELRGGGRGNGGGFSPPSEETQKKITALGKEAEEKIAGALTDDQKKAWKDMVGEKFDTSKLRQGFGGGRTRQDS